MTTMTTPASHPQPFPIENQILHEIKKTVLNAGTGALAAYLFTTVNPLGGAVFCVVYFLTEVAGTHLSDSFNHTAFKITGYVVSLIAAIGAATLVTTALGFSITVLGGAVFLLAILVSRLVIALLIGVASGVASLFGGAFLATLDCSCS